MRVKSSILNISAGLGNQLLITILSFVSRTVFINILGIQYLGINGLFTNIFSMLALVEAGIGSSIIYSLYKPVSENDTEKIKILMNLYKKSYLVIAVVIFLLGLSILPFLNIFVKDPNIKNIHIIYMIFLLNTAAPYLYVHKNNLLQVYQKNYIVTITYSISSLISMCLKIIILYFTKNYILYLIIDIILSLTNSFILSLMVNKMYPFIKEKTNNRLDNETKHSIIKNIKAIVFQNIGNYLIFGTDNIIISSFISIVAVGIYSNYNMLIEISRNITYQIFHNLYHSIGNLVAKENIEKIYGIYRVYRLLNFWLYSLFSIILLILINPFIKLWLGQQYLMSKSVILILILIFYERGMRNSITTLKTTAGIFNEDRFASLIQAFINLCFSILLVKRLGIEGVFLGTLISVLAVPFWFTPYLVYKKLFRKSLIQYYLNYLLYLILGVITFVITNQLSSFIIPNNYLNIIMIGTISFIIPNMIYIVIFFRTQEFKYLLNVLKLIIGNIHAKINSQGKVKLRKTKNLI